MADQPTPGRILALDVGTRRIGVAVCDELQMTARPYKVLERNRKAIAAIHDLVAELQARKILVGLPLHLDGTEGEQAAEVRSFAAKLEKKAAVEIIYWDERLSTVDAEERSGSRKSEHGIDARAAAVILESYLSQK